MATGEFEVNLERCTISDQGCKYLVSGLHKYLDTRSAVTTLLHMDMDSNAISHHAIPYLSKLLSIGCINILNIDFNDFASKHDGVLSFSVLAEQLKNNATLEQLWLLKCGLNSQSAESLAEALTTNRHLNLLSVSNNALCDDGIRHLAHALRINQGLQHLYLQSCGMTDVGLECLAHSLQHNKALTRLNLSNYAQNQNRLTEKIVPILTECFQNNHSLTELELPKNLESSATRVEEAINGVRKRRGLPLIKVKGMSVPLNKNCM